MIQLSSIRHRIAPLGALLIAALLAGCLQDDDLSSNETGTDDAGTQPVAPVEVNRPPVISGQPSDNVMAGEVYSFTPKAIDPDNDSLEFRIRNKPSWAAFNKNSGRVSGTPAASDVGLKEGIELSVSDGEFVARLAPFEIEVLDVPPAPRTVEVSKKYHPGHYISMNRFDSQADMIESIKPGVAGLQKRYFWNELEPAYDSYDFAEIKSDLDLMKSQGMQLVIIVVDKTFGSGIATPPYLDGENSIRNITGGYTAKRWSPYVVKRFKALMLRLAQRFDDHPAFEGVAIQESSLSLNEQTLTRTGYSTAAYRNALVDILVTSAADFRRSQVFWYMNFFPRGQDNLVEIANRVRGAGVIMGGPDILPDDEPLQRLTYPIYGEFAGRMKLFNSIQYNSYAHRHADGSYATKYWTMPELYRFARDELHVSYIFWNRKTWKEPADSYDWQDALPVISRNPQINP